MVLFSQLCQCYAVCLHVMVLFSQCYVSVVQYVFMSRCHLHKVMSVLCSMCSCHSVAFTGRCQCCAVCVHVTMPFAQGDVSVVQYVFMSQCCLHKVMSVFCSMCSCHSVVYTGRCQCCAVHLHVMMLFTQDGVSVVQYVFMS